jgi:hypothetical protein
MSNDGYLFILQSPLDSHGALSAYPTQSRISAM